MRCCIVLLCFAVFENVESEVSSKETPRMKEPWQKLPQETRQISKISCTVTFAQTTMIIKDLCCSQKYYRHQLLKINLGVSFGPTLQKMIWIDCPWRSLKSVCWTSTCLQLKNEVRTFWCIIEWERSRMIVDCPLMTEGPLLIVVSIVLHHIAGQRRWSTGHSIMND